MMFTKKRVIPYIYAFLLFWLTSSLAFASGNGEIAVVDGVNPITISQMEEVYAKPGTVILDANTEEIRKELGVIKNAILVNQENLAASLPTDKKTTIVVYCMNRLCSASSQVALIVQKMGYTNVSVMLEGVEGWVLSGRPTEKINITQWLKSPNIDNYTDAVHKGLLFGELPACRDCHGVTGIEIATANTKSMINESCTSCHKDEQKSFSASAHAESARVNMTGAQLFDNSDKLKTEAAIAGTDNVTKTKPVCWDCHSIHKPGLYEKFNRKQVASDGCGKCHEKELKTFRDTFHGKALFLTTADDMPTVSACYDCHSKHNMQKTDNMNSTLHTINRVDTCQKCHEKSNENFVGFLGHPDPKNKEQNKALFYVSLFFVCLIATVFIFFGIHTILWWVRMLIMRMADPVAWKKARDAAHHDKIEVRRFTLLHRFQHFFMAISFLTLSMTGLPQMFYHAPWAKTLTTWLGGPIMLTQIHHVAAVVLFIVFVTHVVEVSKLSWRRRDSIRNPETGKLELKRFLKAFFGPESLFPRGQDFKDLIAHIKWFLFMGPRPQFDRWTYWEKFDYLAEVWGMFTFGITGLILWFPTTIGSIFPGWVINLSTIIHSYEALLAIGFIFAIHFFNTHFRIDRFPMDMVIFSGNLTKEELVQERKIWYDRLEKEGKLAELIEDGEKFKSYAIITKILGFVMLSLGLTFLFLMIYAFVYNF